MVRHLMNDKSNLNVGLLYENRSIDLKRVIERSEYNPIILFMFFLFHYCVDFLT